MPQPGFSPLYELTQGTVGQSYELAVIPALLSWTDKRFLLFRGQCSELVASAPAMPATSLWPA